MTSQPAMATEPTIEVTGQPAITDPATKAVLRRSGRRAWLVLSVGLLLSIAFMTTATLVAQASQELVDNGGQTSGQVVSLTKDGRSTEGSAQIEYTVNGRELTGTQDLGGDVAKYQLAEPVTVYYDLHNPSRFTIDDETNQPGWSVFLMVLLFVSGVVTLIAGVILLVRHRGLSRVLARCAWLPVWIEPGPGPEPKKQAVHIWFAGPDGKPSGDRDAYLCKRSAAVGMFNRVPGKGALTAAQLDQDLWHGRWHTDGFFAGTIGRSAVFTVPAHDTTGGRIKLIRLDQPR